MCIILTQKDYINITEVKLDKREKLTYSSEAVLNAKLGQLL